MLLKFWQRN